MRHDVEHHIHESPKSMTVPLVILALCSLGAGYLGMPHSLGGTNRFEKFLEPVFAKEAQVLEQEGKASQLAAAEKQVEHTDPLEYALMFASVGAAVVGWWLAQRAYKNAAKGYKEPINEISPRFYKTLFRKWYVDEIYDWVFTGRAKVGEARLGVLGLGEASSKFDSTIIDGTVNGAGSITRLGGAISAWWDKWIIDGVGVNGPALLARVASYPMRLLELGLVQWYAFIMVVGILGMGAYYFVPESVWMWMRVHWFLSTVGIVISVIVAALLIIVIQRMAEGRRPVRAES
jgi:NADH-quinone oxidoreductase subunit L